MMSTHLSSKQHRIIGRFIIFASLKLELTVNIDIIEGLDPAKPIIQHHGSKSFRLTEDDAYHVQLILTNAGQLGQSLLSGSINFCVNGGRDQVSKPKFMI